MRDIQHFFVAAICRYLNDLRSRQKGRIVLPIENIQKKNDLLYLYIRETVTHPESLKIEIHGEEIPSEYRCILYDDYLHALVLSVPCPSLPGGFTSFSFLFVFSSCTVVLTF